MKELGHDLEIVARGRSHVKVCKKCHQSVSEILSNPHPNRCPYDETSTKKENQ